jgi:hypothetical protein
MTNYAMTPVGDTESVPKNGQVQLRLRRRLRAHARAAFKLAPRCHWQCATVLPTRNPASLAGDDSAARYNPQRTRVRILFCFKIGEWGFKIILKLHSPILEQNRDNDFKASFSKISLNKTKRHWQVLPVDRRGLDTTVQDFKADSLFLKS